MLSGRSKKDYAKEVQSATEDPDAPPAENGAASENDLEPPVELAQIGALPPGWELRGEGDIVGSATRLWERVWSPDADPWAAEGDPILTLYQAFGGSFDEAPGGDVRPGVGVNGQHATLDLHRPTGAMTLVWSLGEDELALKGYRADFTQAEFVDVAESVRLADD